MLELYQIEDCFFCRNVRLKLAELELDYVTKYVPREASLRDQVEEISGQRLVPVLVDPEAGEIIPDSQRIIEYLEKKYVARSSG